MQLYFIRHAQSFNNALWYETGSSQGRSEDPELTDVGRQQVDHLARFLARSSSESTYLSHDPQNVRGFGITHIYTSLMVRSVATALTVAEALDLPVAGWEDLHETGGIFQEGESGERIGLPGKTRSYFQSNYPGLTLPEALNEEGWWNRPYEQEEYHMVRAQRVLQDLLARHGNTPDRVAFVSHGNFYRHFMAAVLKMPDSQSYYFELNNAGISRIDFGENSDGMIIIGYLNRVDFLPTHLIT